MDNPDFAVPAGDLEAFDATMRTITRSAETFSKILTGGLRSALVDGKSLDQVFRQMALSLSSRTLNSALRPLETLAENTVTRMLVGAAGSLPLSALKGVSGLLPFARGGVIGTPTYFGLDSNGSSGSGAFGVAGEAGAEAILPLMRGHDGRLGVRSGASEGHPRIEINVTARDADSFRRSEAQVSAMVARAVGRGRRGL